MKLLDMVLPKPRYKQNTSLTFNLYSKHSYQKKEVPCKKGSMHGIFTYIWLKCMVNVGKYTSPMDPMGYTYQRPPLVGSI